MLPLSLGRMAPSDNPGRGFRAALGWLKPANIAATSRAERYAINTWLAIFLAALVLSALGHVWLRLQVRDLGYRLSTTRQLIDRLQLEEHELTVHAAQLDAPGRIAEVARQRLGMERPQRGQEALLP